MDNKLLPENNDLKELKLSEGISVWGTNQEILEKQALKELETLVNNDNQNTDAIEEGEIIELESNVENDRKPKETSLDIDKYIKRQQELKKRQEHKKSLSVSEYSKEIGQKVSEKNKSSKSKRTKRKKYDFDKNSTPEPEHAEHKEQVEPVVNTRLLGDYSVPEEDCSDKSGSEYIPSDSEFDSDYYEGSERAVNEDNSLLQKPAKRKRVTPKTEHIEKVVDDGLLQHYQLRLDLHYKQLEEELSLKASVNDEVEDCEHHSLRGGLKVPFKVWQNLYSYQRDGVKWLWKIHQEPSGGLLGDEMGLGKTVQIIAFFNSLEYSKILSCHGRFKGLGPSLIVCPATVIHQWVKHFHDWAPEFRVAVLHQSGSYQGNKVGLIKEISKCRGIIVTTYLGILKYKGNLLEYNWHYMVLDEGHKIRNPTAKVSIAVKQIRTPHRILLTGSPMQNNLTELWSLFDFVNPGMLGNVTTFQEHFATPILHGGFSNSTPMQEATALSVATTLKNVITPYLLRRSKSEVQHDISLPNKNEQVLFCSLTQEQRDLYKGYLMSEHVNMILGRGVKNWYSENHTRANVLVGITNLRKICNHPDIYLSEAHENRDEDDESVPFDERLGYYKRSGKMIVVSALLKIWKKQGHRVLLFSQGRAMIAIFQNFLEQQSYKYLKMDGSTSISSRQPLIDKFNQDTTYDVFLLTTRVGGLGVNLTGANRVIIFDPDWNPATDTQARERAWRIGQEKQVTIYRLLSAGTIEEKMYQRQVWKQLLSNKVLLDPKTNRFFKNSDLHDLFSLQESVDSNPETTNIFRDSRVRIQESIKDERKKKKKKSKSDNNNLSNFKLSDDKIQAMKNLAQRIAKSLNKEQGETTPPKTSLQIDLEFEKQEKLKEKKKLKKLTAQELLFYNRDKANQRDDDTINRVDGCETSTSFSSALEYSEKTAKLHQVLVSGKVKDPAVLTKKVEDMKKSIISTTQSQCADFSDNNDDEDKERHSLKSHKKHKRKKGHKEKSSVDTSGTVDGEVIEGLVKSEVKRKKKKKEKTRHTESQDDFVLGKLFSKKGVFGALQHDTVVQSGVQGKSLKIHTEAQMRAERSLEALRKSRIDSWRW